MRCIGCSSENKGFEILSSVNRRDVEDKWDGI
jgi:hypothetical protein